MTVASEDQSPTVQAPEELASEGVAVEASTDAAPAAQAGLSVEAERVTRERAAFTLSYAEPKVVLFTTTSGAADAVENLARMIEGLRRQAGGGALIHAILLVQQDQATTDALMARLDAPPFVEAIAAGGRLSLSAARNRMLVHATERGVIGVDDVVAFPDDDSWYPEGLLTKVQYLFASDPFFEFFFCRYGTETETCHLSRCDADPSTQTVISNASSNTIFVRGRLANLIGGFDETLGVGARHKAGEDLDYALRAYLCADQRAYLDAPLVGHRDKDPALRAKYFGGSLLVLSRFALRSWTLMSAVLRKLAVGLLLTAAGRLPIREFSRSVAVAAGQFGRAGGSD